MRAYSYLLFDESTEGGDHIRVPVGLRLHARLYHVDRYQHRVRRRAARRPARREAKEHVSV